MTRPILELKGLRKAFGALVVTDDVTLDIGPSEFHAVIGPNGAGKTTLIGEITGELSIDAGSVTFAGEDIGHLPVHARALRGLTRSFQITQVLPGFSVLDNVATAVQAHSGSSFRFFRPVAAERALNDKAFAALEQVGLDARAASDAASLSHGEKRQLELAMALASEPKLLLLDEPMAGMGREETEGMVEVLLKLKGRYPIVLVEHDMHAVFRLADRISVLVYGRLIASGTPDSVRANPAVREAYLGAEEFA
ncbi:ABC transporter ATP-binding protein [Phreatobacter sp. AB_2022a]|uniref:ABC transporter ATP-binding protein n=1 Tax=Phreatobacter sp. AB_2022a TaxID=3003134 RepID=UPI00228748B7|nr:ABC transporter ATP-binding protein [Phreatobacter sp. AB_2022a]MCZ0733671.1 ABC transporter ATP-binding protein [Phreatobacter sp. AB_2022a]